MTARTTCNSLQVATPLYRFIEDKVLPGTGIKSADFWKGFDELVKDLSPKNEALLAKRDRIQLDLDKWHQANPGPIKDMPAYRKFLKEIGYLDEVPGKVVGTTKNVDDELALQAGPQLVVPVLNARYALNAANARWGSLYDALYGTDVISEADGATKDGAYNPIRGAKVVAFARQFLDESAPLAGALYSDVVAYSVVDKKLSVKLKDGSTTGLVDENQFVGYQGTDDQCSAHQHRAAWRLTCTHPYQQNAKQHFQQGQQRDLGRLEYTGATHRQHAGNSQLPQAQQGQQAQVARAGHEGKGQGQGCCCR